MEKRSRARRCLSSRAQCPGAAPGRGRRNRKSKTQPGDSRPQSRWQRAGLAAHPADLPCPQPRSDPSPRLFPQRTKKFHLDFGFGTLFQAPPAGPILLGQGSGLSKRPRCPQGLFYCPIQHLQDWLNTSVLRCKPLEKPPWSLAGSVLRLPCPRAALGTPRPRAEPGQVLPALPLWCPRVQSQPCPSRVRCPLGLFLTTSS